MALRVDHLPDGQQRSAVVCRACSLSYASAPQLAKLDVVSLWQCTEQAAVHVALQGDCAVPL